MERARVIGLLVLASVVLLAPPASGWYTYVGPSGHPLTEDNLMGWGGVLDNLYGVDNVTRCNDAWDQIWYNPDGSAIAQVKYAGYDQQFGYFANASGSAFTAMFKVEGTGYQDDLTVTGLNGFTPDEDGWFNFTAAMTGSNFRPGDDPIAPPPNPDPPAWSSLMTDNSGYDHMVTWEITGGASAGGYVVCWEDKFHTDWDQDYQDLVIEMRGVNPIPEPSTIALLALGASTIGLGLWRRRRR